MYKAPEHSTLLLYFKFRSRKSIFIFSKLYRSENFICFAKLSSLGSGLRSLIPCRDFSSGNGAVVPMLKSQPIKE